ncbi:MAG: glycosyltransferase family 2 protein [Kiritimatiellae bacterium]|jgi:glycosyltransferase involved in cell wall biosynthesis|nr:glycosyltransferase family 2 protein [Kiritimatiellia bacterium]
MISFVIPVYQSAGTLPELKNRIVHCFEAGGCEFEILFIEDGGGDASWEVIEGLARKDPRVRGFRLSRNYGQHNALLCGIREAKGDRIITLDDDLQHPPEEVPKLLATLEEGYDVVYGSPEHEQHGLIRDLASTITKIIVKYVMGVKHAGNVSSLRVFRSHVRNAFAEYRNPTVNLDVLLTWGTTKFAAIRVRHEPRRQGRSGYTTKKLILHAMNMITGFSAWPLRFTILVGAAVLLAGTALLDFVIVRWILAGSQVPRSVLLVSIVALFSGAHLLVLGIFGEYMARMHMRRMERPAYVVFQQT